MAADFTNPLANSGDQGLEFVNADYTLYLHRLPVGEWIGASAQVDYLIVSLLDPNKKIKENFHTKMVITSVVTTTVSRKPITDEAMMKPGRSGAFSIFTFLIWMPHHSPRHASNTRLLKSTIKLTMHTPKAINPTTNPVMKAS